MRSLLFPRLSSLARPPAKSLKASVVLLRQCHRGSPAEVVGAVASCDRCNDHGGAYAGVIGGKSTSGDWQSDLKETSRSALARKKSADAHRRGLGGMVDSRSGLRIWDLTGWSKEHCYQACHYSAFGISPYPSTINVPPELNTISSSKQHNHRYYFSQDRKSVV